MTYAFLYSSHGLGLQQNPPFGFPAVLAVCGLLLFRYPNESPFLRYTFAFNLNPAFPSFSAFDSSFELYLAFFHRLHIYQLLNMATRKCAAVVVGAGPAGVAVMGNLLERQLGTIAWIDPSFESGRVHRKYREVPRFVSTRSRAFAATDRQFTATPRSHSSRPTLQPCNPSEPSLRTHANPMLSPPWPSWIKRNPAISTMQPT